MREYTSSGDARAGYLLHPQWAGYAQDVLDFVRVLLGLASDLVRRRVGLAAENLLLRRQLIVAERKIAGRVRWTPWQRLTVVLGARFAPAWREATLLIKPATVL